VQVDAYFAQLRTALRASPFIASSEIQEDARTAHEGFFKANANLIDGSFLSLREYVNTSGDSVVRYSYSYHYQKELQLIDTPHYPQLSSFPHHKHLADGRVVPCEPPTLENVIHEIESHLRKSTL
jgi:hypothetical protein